MLVHTAVHTTVAGPSGHLPTLGRRVSQPAETTGQPGFAVTGPASRSQRLAARRASKGILTHSRPFATKVSITARAPPAAVRVSPTFPRADHSNPGLSGGLRELNNASGECSQVQC